MGDVWHRYLKDIAAQRHLDAAQLSAQIDDYAIARQSQRRRSWRKSRCETKLVDELATKDQAEAALAAKGAPRTIIPFARSDSSEYSAVVERQMALDTRPQIAVVVAEGEILGGDQPPGTVGGDSTARLVREAREDDVDQGRRAAREFTGRRCVRVRTDPPRNRTDASAAGKPVIVSMGDVAASRRLLDFDGRRRDLRAADHDHRIDRHLRSVLHDSEHAGQDRRAYRRRRHHTARRRARSAAVRSIRKSARRSRR